MKGLIVWLSVLLIAGHLMTFASPVLAQIYPGLLSKKVNLFVTGGYEMEYWWYIKFMTDDLLWVTVFFVLARVSYQYSAKLFLISLLFFLYHCVDALMFWYDFKQSPWLSRGLMAVIVASIVFLVVPFKEKSKYKSLI